MTGRETGLSGIGRRAGNSMTGRETGLSGTGRRAGSSMTGQGTGLSEIGRRAGTLMQDSLQVTLHPTIMTWIRMMNLLIMLRHKISKAMTELSAAVLSEKAVNMDETIVTVTGRGGPSSKVRPGKKGIVQMKIMNRKSK